MKVEKAVEARYHEPRQPKTGRAYELVTFRMEYGKLRPNP
tara:strand:- start:123 stop:242 length:120 start_codon:yes stop_codon:yes gene_type:complete